MVKLLKIQKEMEQTLEQYNETVKNALPIIKEKSSHTAYAWRLHKVSDITKMLWIFTQRIRELEECKHPSKDCEEDFFNLLNYGVIALIQLNSSKELSGNINEDTFLSLYCREIETTRNLMEDKNHDYGEAWRKMRISSITDLILMKILRVQQIEKNNGHTIISEPVDANYRDIVNYAIFALIKIKEET